MLRRLPKLLNETALLTIGAMLIVLPWLIDVSPWSGTLFSVATLEGRFIKIEWAVGIVLGLVALRSLWLRRLDGVSLYTLGFYIFIALHLFQLYFGQSGYTSFHREAFFHYATAIVLAPILYHLVHDWHDFGFLRFLILVGALLPTLYGIWQQVVITFPGAHPWLIDPIGWEPNRLLKSRIVSTFGNPNYFGSYLAGAFVFLLPMALKRRQGSVRLGFLVAFLAAMLYCIYMSKSRGAVLGLLFGGFGMLWFGVFLLQDRRWRWAVRGGLVFVLVLVMSGFVYKGYQATGQESLVDRIGEGLQGRSPSINNRMVLWQVGLAIWGQHPVQGAGLEEFSIKFIPTLMDLLSDKGSEGYRTIVANMESIFATAAHNEYVQYLAELGVLGLGTFLFFNIAILWALVFVLKERSRLRLRRTDETFAILGCIGALLAVLADSCYNFPLRLPVNAYLYFVICGLSLAMIRHSGTDVTLRLPVLPALPARVKRGVVCAVLLACSALTITAWGREHAAHSFFHRGQIAFNDMMAGRWERQKDAESFFYDALNYAPEYGEIHFYLGRILATTEDERGALQKMREAARTWNNSGIYVQTGWIYFNNNEFARAREAWQQVADIHPRMEQIHHSIGLSYFRSGNMDAAREEFETELKYHSSEPYAKEVYLYLAEVERAEGNWAAAEENYRQVLRRSRNHFYAHLRLAELYSQEIPNSAQALEHIRQAKRLSDLSRDPQVRQEFQKVDMLTKERFRNILGDRYRTQ